MGHPSLWGRSDLGHPPNEAEERRNGVPLLPSGWGAGDSLGMHTVTAVFGETRVFQRKKLRATPPPGAGTHATEVPPRDNRCPSEGLLPPALDFHSVVGISSCRPQRLKRRFASIDGLFSTSTVVPPGDFLLVSSLLFYLLPPHQ